MSSPQITISLTSISSRMPVLARTLQSLLAQDHPNFLLRLYLSRDPFLLDQGVRFLPPEIEEIRRRDDRFEIRFVPNIGPYRKILPFLSETAGRRCLVATADDDTIYPADWLSGLYRVFLDHRCVVCYRGHTMRRNGPNFANYRSWMQSGISRNPDLFNLPTGKDGVLYDTSHFSPLVLDYVSALKVAPTADDLWLKWHYSAINYIPTYVINSNYTINTFEQHDVYDGLYTKFNRDGGNDKTVSSLEEYALARFGKAFAAQNL